MSVTMHRSHAIFFALLMIIVALPLPLQAQTTTQTDAGQSGDAGNTRTEARLITSSRYEGRLVSSTDTADWYRISVANSAPRHLIQVFLNTDPSNNFDLHLFNINAIDSQPTATGRGGSGSRVIEYSANLDGTWYIRISGTATGRYHFTVSVSKGGENDGPPTSTSSPRDAADTNSDMTFSFSGSGNMTIRGNLTWGDSGDRYSVILGSSPSPDFLFAGLQFPRGAGLRVEIVGAVNDVVKVGDGFATAYRPGPGSAAGQPGSITGTQTFRVTRAGASVDTPGGPYVLTIRKTWPSGGDAGQIRSGENLEAPNSEYDENLPRVQVGTFKGHLDTGSALAPTSSDRADVFEIVAPSNGRILHVGVSSYAGGTTPPLLRATLFHVRPGSPDPEVKATLTSCDVADGIALSGALGRWVLRIEEAVEFGGCSASVNQRQGDYAFYVHLSNQTDKGGLGGDAPGAIGSALVPSQGLFGTGWMDGNEANGADNQQLDSYLIGKLDAGSLVRAGVYASSPGMELRIKLWDVNKTAPVATTLTSTSGAIRLYAVAERTEVYVLQVEDMSSGHRWGSYKYTFSNTSNAAPTVITLNTPPAADIGRNSVKLTWTESPDADFARYELHRSKTQGFTPGTGTLHTTITTKSTTTSTPSGLDSGAIYEFLIRVVDTSTLATNSNRVLVDLQDPLINNQAPSLSNPAVTPASATTGSSFTWSVRYTDPEGTDAVLRKVFIDGTSYDMTKVSGTAATGAEYRYSKTLTRTPLDHTYRFEFSDGDLTVRSPAEGGDYSGPVVNEPGNDPPTVTATATPNQGPAPLQVQFEAVASDPNGDALTYTWDFDNRDGSTQTDASVAKPPKHTYTDVGTRIATLRVRDARGAETIKNLEIVVQAPTNKPPTADASATPSSGTAPLDVVFASGAADSDGTISAYEWDFDNSNGVSVQSTQQGPGHRYTTPGTYIATVTVTDNGGARATDTVSVTVRTASNAPPSITIFADPGSGPAPLLVQFTADAADADGDSISISWDFDASNGIQTDATGSSATKTFSVVGSFTVLAVARDTSGATATATTVVTVGGGTGGTGAPTVFVQASPMRGTVPLTVHFTADTTRMPMAPVRYEWDFGDASPIETTDAANHVFQAPGKYVVRLTVTDQGGNDYESTVTIDVTAKAKSPAPAFGAFIALALAVTVLNRRRSPER